MPGRRSRSCRRGIEFALKVNSYLETYTMHPLCDLADRLIENISFRASYVGRAFVLVVFVSYSLGPSVCQARILSDLEYTEAGGVVADKTLTEDARRCQIARSVIKAVGDHGPCTKEDLGYGARVLASYRAAVVAVNDPDFISNDYGAVASSQSRNDLNEPDADQAACAVAISDTYWGPVERPRLITHPPSCSSDMVAYGLRLIKDYQKAIKAEDLLP